MNLKDPNRLRELQEAVTREYNISADTLRLLLAKVEEYSESHRAFGLPEDLLAILQDSSPVAESFSGSSRREEALIQSFPGSSRGDEALINPLIEHELIVDSAKQLPPINHQLAIHPPIDQSLLTSAATMLGESKSKVFIDSITLENFGPYYGEHTFNFATLEDRCGILIGGKTGAGKTHLLRALYLAVVGEAGVIDLKKVEPGSEATRFLFEKSLNRRAQAEGRDTTRFQVGISQRDDLGGATRKALLVREIRHRPNAAPVWYSYAGGAFTDHPHIKAAA